MGWEIRQGDCLEVLKTLPGESVQTCVTSPPYWGLRDYGVAGQMGAEATPDLYIAGMVAVFEEVRRVLKKDGTLWLNLGDTYLTKPHGDAGVRQTLTGNRPHRDPGRPNRKPIPGLKHKDLVGIPWRTALALQAAGWYLRCDIIWNKANCLPESVSDRPTKSHEYIFLFSKSQKYFYDATAIAEDKAEVTKSDPRNNQEGRRADRNGKGQPSNAGTNLGGPEGKRNKRSVWTVSATPFTGAHFATFPPKLILPCILAGSRPGDLVLDPFNGAATTGHVAIKQQRNYLGIELKAEYVALSRERIESTEPLLNWAEK